MPFHQLLEPMRTLSTALLILATIFSVGHVHAQSDYRTENVFLITLDGLRWQELYSGADKQLVTNEAYVENTKLLEAMFWTEDPSERRERLMPFFWNTIATKGQLYGNLNLDCPVTLTNNQWFSYPGYNEILTGFDDPRIRSNNKIPNPNKTVLEIINEMPAFDGKVAAFGSWDVFPYIINEARSGIPVNAGFEPAATESLTDRELFLNNLQTQIPSPWETVRLDAFTHHFALEHIKKKLPRLVYIAYGETDDFAHNGKYDAYLKSAHVRRMPLSESYGRLCNRMASTAIKRRLSSPPTMGVVRCHSTRGEATEQTSKEQTKSGSQS